MDVFAARICALSPAFVVNESTCLRRIESRVFVRPLALIVSLAGKILASVSNTRENIRASDPCSSLNIPLHALRPLASGKGQGSEGQGSDGQSVLVYSKR